MKENKFSKFVLYSPYTNSFIRKLTELLDESFPTAQYEVYFRWEALKKRLQLLRQDICSVILIAPTRNALEMTMAIQPLVEGLKVVLVLPDRDGDTIEKAHTFRPRYFTYVDTDFRDIVIVLKKISDKHRTVMLSFNDQISDEEKFEKMSLG